MSTILDKYATIKENGIAGKIVGCVEYLAYPNKYLIAPNWDLNENKDTGLAKDDPYQGSIWSERDEFYITEKGE